jgi:hypothetical protein
MAWSVGEKKGETKKTEASKVVELRPSAKDASGDVAGRQKPKGESDREGGRDLAGGMEMLELDFLLSVVENTRGDDKNDVMMRKLNFNELLRREQLNEIDSNTLKVYAVDEGNLYGKDIQCQAIKELTVRTARKGKHGG